MRETDVIKLLRARAESYDVSTIAHIKGQRYRVVWKGQEYDAVCLLRSFDFYEKRYHLCLDKPDLIICFKHDTWLPIPCMALALGNIAIAPEDYPEGITDSNLETLRHNKSSVAGQVLIGLYLNGTQRGQNMMKALRKSNNKKRPNAVSSTYRRYLARIEQLGKRKRGKPVGIMSDTATAKKKKGSKQQ
jgi:hypothetical protein